MAAADYIGNVTAMYIKSTDQLDNEYSTNIAKGFTVNPQATYQKVDDAIRGAFSLSTNTYSDTTLVTEISLNEAMES